MEGYKYQKKNTQNVSDIKQQQQQQGNNGIKDDDYYFGYSENKEHDFREENNYSGNNEYNFGYSNHHSEKDTEKFISTSGQLFNKDTEGDIVDNDNMEAGYDIEAIDDINLISGEYVDKNGQISGDDDVDNQEFSENNQFNGDNDEDNGYIGQYNDSIDNTSQFSGDGDEDGIDINRQIGVEGNVDNREHRENNQYSEDNGYIDEDNDEENGENNQYSGDNGYIDEDNDEENGENNQYNGDNEYIDEDNDEENGENNQYSGDNEYIDEDNEHSGIYDGNIDGDSQFSGDYDEDILLIGENGENNQFSGDYDEDILLFGENNQFSGDYDEFIMEFPNKERRTNENRNLKFSRSEEKLVKCELKFKCRLSSRMLFGITRISSTHIHYNGMRGQATQEDKSTREQNDEFINNCKDIKLSGERIFYINTLTSNVKRDGSQWSVTNVESTDFYGQSRVIVVTSNDFPDIRKSTGLNIKIGQIYITCDNNKTLSFDIHGNELELPENIHTDDMFFTMSSKPPKKDICKYQRPCDDVCVDRANGTFDCSCSIGHFLTLGIGNRTCIRPKRFIIFTDFVYLKLYDLDSKRVQILHVIDSSSQLFGVTFILGHVYFSDLKRQAIFRIDTRKYKMKPEMFLKRKSKYQIYILLDLSLCIIGTIYWTEYGENGGALRFSDLSSTPELGRVLPMTIVSGVKFPNCVTGTLSREPESSSTNHGEYLQLYLAEGYTGTLWSGPIYDSWSGKREHKLKRYPEVMSPLPYRLEAINALAFSNDNTCGGASSRTSPINKDIDTTSAPGISKSEKQYLESEKTAGSNSSPKDSQLSPTNSNNSSPADFRSSSNSPHNRRIKITRYFTNARSSNAYDGALKTHPHTYSHRKEPSYKDHRTPSSHPPSEIKPSFFFLSWAVGKLGGLNILEHKTHGRSETRNILTATRANALYLHEP